mgnify:CR=1 FL=1
MHRIKSDFCHGFFVIIDIVKLNFEANAIFAMKN